MREAAVLTNEEVAPSFFRIAVVGSFPAEPAQFYMLRAWHLDPPLARPMSVFERTEEQVSFLYKVRGKGTKLLSRLKPGDALSLLGPLGNGWQRSDGRIALIGGGCGIAPLLHTAKVFGEVDLYLGFQDRPFLVEAFEKLATRVVITSESGRGGRMGVVIDDFDPANYEACYACGPHEMLKTLAQICNTAGVPLIVSLEERMACGIGACLGCAVKTTNGVRSVCRDGPVFRAEEVVWDG
jgi:dihydroorotate dehydrogenase electron transfer subunit